MEEFTNNVIKALKMKLGEGYRIFSKEQRKNNELVLYGICIHKENESMLSKAVTDEPAERSGSSALGHQTLPDIIPQDKRLWK
ncbi:MAG: hypothetical protein K2N44_18055 [Lachnospiraceae bacterium]|nr:hypothetical protein [Lachnospiraceae bacterium]